MARADRSTRPVETFRDAVRSLEAAALVCMASPKKKPVHQLRTWTRRVEAQLELIAMLDDVPRAPKERGRVVAILKKLRRAAGKVRDLDVERDLIAELSSRAGGRSRAVLSMRKEARTLRRDLGRQRDDEADALVSLLKKQQKRLPLVLKDLSDAFKPSHDAAVGEDGLTALVRDWYARSNPLTASATGDESEALHSIRKRAKLARYMAQSSPKPAARAQRLAARFEAVQQAGGVWHDWMQLSRIAAKELGESAQLPRRFAARADRALRSYNRRLARPIFP